MLTQREIDSLVRRVVDRIQPQKVIVFGSYAKGTATLRSDLDLFIVKDTELPMRRRGDDLKPILGTVLVPVDVHVYTPEEVQEYGKEPYSFVHSVLRSGKTLFSAAPPDD